MTDATPEPHHSKIDTSVPHSARIWNYWLGGTDNYAVDRAAGDAYKQTFPGIVDMARASRHFLARSIHLLAGELGVRQFLDLGTGLPTVDNTHEVAQRVAPESRIVYVDNDPLVLAHARALLTSTTEGATRYIDADLHDPDKIIELAGETLDITRPIAVMFMGVLGHITDDDEARSVVRRVMERVPSGSYLAIYDATDEDEAFRKAQSGYDETGAVPYILRGPEFIRGYFEGTELLDPGVVPECRWRPEPGIERPWRADLCGVGRKP
ncbi:SAM-dependent methyltransferase [Actinomadura kijaniata]|uniref:O-methyltransferase involved in polyketide biosynthesis n=1 Tax=Actinomadura namibiensis TaxID=182080 RepID=A0A7W3LMS9_ACTNM|nr:SAM-dependent methyltransferase [Actinomadura namibiensis]MBA8951020.1 O-methyltransferase involved in polyketide biosynthesis [Actinomadura namibiensis]